MTFSGPWETPPVQTGTLNGTEWGASRLDAVYAAIAGHSTAFIFSGTGNGPLAGSTRRPAPDNRYLINEGWIGLLIRLGTDVGSHSLAAFTPPPPANPTAIGWEWEDNIGVVTASGRPISAISELLNVTLHFAATVFEGSETIHVYAEPAGSIGLVGGGGTVGSVTTLADTDEFVPAANFSSMTGLVTVLASTAGYEATIPVPLTAFGDASAVSAGLVGAGLWFAGDRQLTGTAPAVHDGPGYSSIDDDSCVVNWRPPRFRYVYDATPPLRQRQRPTGIGAAAGPPLRQRGTLGDGQPPLLQRRTL